MAEPRKTFGPVVLLGLASGVLAAVAGSKHWGTLSSGTYDEATGSYRIDAGQVVATGAAEMPLAGALALVLLACWGVVLVTRGLVRRVVAVLAALTAVALLVTAVVGIITVPDALLGAVEDGGVSTDAITANRTVWPWAALIGAVGSVLAALAAVRLTPSWPEMGARYDSPTGETAPVEPEGNLELWRALDEGHDPTESHRPLD